MTLFEVKVKGKDITEIFDNLDNAWDWAYSRIVMNESEKIVFLWKFLLNHYREKKLFGCLIKENGDIKEIVDEKELEKIQMYS